MNEPIRIHKYLSQIGLASRREIERWIEAGRIELNGTTASVSDQMIPEKDVLKLDGKRIKSEPVEPLTLLFNKPKGIVCSHSDPLHPVTLFDVLPRNFQDQKLMYAGRLDKDSEGLMVLSNDGELIQRLTHPSSQVVKRYHILLDRPLEQDLIPKLMRGMRIEGEWLQLDRIFPAGRGPKAYQTLEIHLGHGKKREIRRIFKRFGYQVESLKRTQIGSITLKGLGEGKTKVLSEEEIKRLFDAKLSPKDTTQDTSPDKGSQRSESHSRPKRAHSRGTESADQNRQTQDQRSHKKRYQSKRFREEESQKPSQYPKATRNRAPAPWQRSDASRPSVSGKRPRTETRSFDPNDRRSEPSSRSFSGPRNGFTRNNPRLRSTDKEARQERPYSRQFDANRRDSDEGFVRRTPTRRFDSNEPRLSRGSDGGTRSRHSDSRRQGRAEGFGSDRSPRRFGPTDRDRVSKRYDQGTRSERFSARSSGRGRDNEFEERRPSRRLDPRKGGFNRDPRERFPGDESERKTGYGFKPKGSRSSFAGPRAPFRNPALRATRSSDEAGRSPGARNKSSAGATRRPAKPSGSQSSRYGNRHRK